MRQKVLQKAFKDLLHFASIITQCVYYIFKSGFVILLHIVA